MERRVNDACGKATISIPFAAAEETFTQSTSTNSLPPSSLWLLPAERAIGGRWDSHPREIADFHGVPSFWHDLGASLKEGNSTQRAAPCGRYRYRPIAKN
jgi:hypothetical protein